MCSKFQSAGDLVETIIQKGMKTCYLDVQQLEVADCQRGGACAQQRDQCRWCHCTAGQELG